MIVIVEFELKIMLVYELNNFLVWAGVYDVLGNQSNNTVGTNVDNSVWLSDRTMHIYWDIGRSIDKTGN